MRSIRVRSAAQFVFAAGVLMLAGCESVPEVPLAGAGARVVAVDGRARYSDATHSWHKLSPGGSLQSGSVIQTALGSTLDLAIPVAGSAEADRILLQSDTALSVEALPTTAGDTNGYVKLQLRKGELTFTSPPSGHGSPCEIRWAKGLASARGATFLLRSEGQLKVFRGVVALKTADEQTARSVPAGNLYDAQTGTLSPLQAGESAASFAPRPVARPQTPQWPPWPTRKY